jgi:hypothetical protein
MYIENYITTEFLCMLDCIIYASYSKPENSAATPLPFVSRFMYVGLHSPPSLSSIALMSCHHCALPHSITANLVALLHVFIFLADLFLFVLHFLCISWVLKMVWTIFPCQMFQQGKVLIVCALRLGWHTPRSWTLLPVHRLAMMLQQWHLLTFPVICALWLHLCYWLEFVSFYNEIHFFDGVLYQLTGIFGEHCSGSSLNFWLLILIDNLFFSFSRVDWIWSLHGWRSFVAKSSWHVASCICVSNCNISHVLFTCSHSTHSTSVALTVHTFLP